MQQPKEPGKAVSPHPDPSIGIFSCQIQGKERQVGAPDGLWAQEGAAASLGTRLGEDKHAVLWKVERLPLK